MGCTQGCAAYSSALRYCSALENKMRLFQIRYNVTTRRWIIVYFLRKQLLTPGHIWQEIGGSNLQNYRWGSTHSTCLESKTAFLSVLFWLQRGVKSISFLATSSCRQLTSLLMLARNLYSKNSKQGEASLFSVEADLENLSY